MSGRSAKISPRKTHPGSHKKSQKTIQRTHLSFGQCSRLHNKKETQ
uniref:Uncharacterized protein n=1 Tax=Anguilla anguilla TaxID=7936 RepID=A0A0E9Q2D5_ANGAN